MTGIKPSTHGIVVDHVESGTRFAISDKNYDVRVHRKVRDLKPGETVLGYRPKRRRSESSEADLGTQGGTSTLDNPAKSESDGSEALSESQGSGTKTEGAAPAASQDKKEGN